MDKDELGDRFAMWALRSVATAMVFAGVSVLVAGVPLFGYLPPEAPVARTIAGLLFQLSGLFVSSGATAMLSVARPCARGSRMSVRRPLTPNGHVWAELRVIVMAIVLVTLPVWLLLGLLQPFLAEWSRVADVLSTFDMWEGADANMSGIVLVPLAEATTHPTLVRAGRVVDVYRRTGGSAAAAVHAKSAISSHLHRM